MTVKLLGIPSQPLKLGVTRKFATDTLLVELVNKVAGIFAEPDDETPIEVKLLVHEKVAPLIELVKLIGLDVAPLQ